MFISYKGLNLKYDYSTYCWIITTKTGELIANFTYFDKAKEFIDALISNG